MEIIATNEGKKFTPAPAGNFISRCYSMVHIGTVPEDFNGEKKMLNKVRITWELPSEIMEDDSEGRCYSISKEFTLLLKEKSNLRKMLASWRGKDFTEEEAKGFDISKLVGVPCMLNVIHKQSNKGNTYADIASISALPKGIKGELPVNDNVVFTITKPDWDVFEKFPDYLKDKIKTSSEYKALQEYAVETPSEHIEENDGNDPLPF